MKLFSSTRPSKQFRCMMYVVTAPEFPTYWQKPMGEPFMVDLAPGPVVGKLIAEVSLTFLLFCNEIIRR